MACSKEMSELLHRVFDGDASEGERHELKEHVNTCSSCRIHYQELRETVGLLSGLGEEEVPSYFTEKVISRLPDRKKTSPATHWFKSHPFMVAAACFLIMMAGYIMSLWHQNSFQADVQGKGQENLVYAENNTVIVPKGKTIKGDLIIKDGNVKIEGKVDGDVVLINSDSLLASAGHVSGKIEEVDQILGWIWYHIKQFFSMLFFRFSFV